MIPFSGQDAAWAVLPLYINLIGYKALLDPLALVSPSGWTIIAASNSSNTPASAKITFPPLVSSAGVPYTIIFPPISSKTLLKATAAPDDITPIILCPHPCPILGNASYSHKYPIVIPGFPLSKVALNAVSISAIGHSTWKLCSFKNIVNASTALYSSFPNSGLLYI